ncbi:chaplin [Streptomyces abikoensis]|uniref:chaplin n=1 Tax=Streptomyces abikoensis TaxID=97398 RepID=UPI00167911CA|nr:chaplin [Streptomyces abikoensis]
MSRIARAVVVTAAVGASLAGFAGSAVADSVANGAAVGSPGVVSGNVIQIPIQIPINLCGNSIDIVGLLNPASGNTCINGDVEGPTFVSEEHHSHSHHGHSHHEH